MSAQSFERKLAALRRDAPRLVEMIIEQAAERIAEGANEAAPVDSGELGTSYHNVKEQSGVSVTSTAAHAPFVELGTRRSPARPHLRPSVDETRRNMPALERRILNARIREMARR